MASDKAAQSLNDIGDAIDRITRMGEQIAREAEQQSITSEQVNGNITKIIERSEPTLSGV
ncbi:MULTISPECIES: hypothetical protein [unclassified Marinobacter]|uniref:hypothetical protein n=1 Tax=unclassified Marinobacter TaxID=83889 RepID=UPI000BF64FF8|nr:MULTISPECIES: hypothetical protein [unclassified Marinobacter]